MSTLKPQPRPRPQYALPPGVPALQADLRAARRTLVFGVLAAGLAAGLGGYLFGRASTPTRGGGNQERR